MPLRVVVAGVGGRMGREIVAAAARDPTLRIVGGTVRPGSPTLNSPWSTVTNVAIAAASLETDPRAFANRADVAIDFTAPAVTVSNAEACAELDMPLVVGTTGLNADQVELLEVSAKSIPLFYAPNMSTGIAALTHLLPLLARTLAGFELEIVETHHRHKADAPSGTALLLADAIGFEMGSDHPRHYTFGRHGNAPRQSGEIGIHAVRSGGNPGEHVVILTDEGEEIRVAHRAFGRAAYVRGALTAAKFVAGRAPGMYRMRDLLDA
ncbi:MAG: 4-hydroxy-tetrahydrodipicolinate reductase [Chloroflexota bacterium]|nr:4-hydroxy-tetrahydrodipicolinate reductase [Chloroflexota bacterium]